MSANQPESPRETSPARLYVDNLRILKVAAEALEGVIADVVDRLLAQSTDPVIVGSRALSQAARQRNDATETTGATHTTGATGGSAAK